jgi:hypothetical protein
VTGWLQNDAISRWALVVAWLERGELSNPSSGLPAAAPRWETGQGGSGMMYVIGIDPHKGSHTAAVLDREGVVRGELRVVAGRAASAMSSSSSRCRSSRALGRSKPRRAGARCSHSSSSPPGKRSSMCLPRCRPGLGSWTAGATTRPTATRLAPPPSWRCATGDSARSRRSTTVRCCACSLTATTTSRPCAHRPSAGCTRCCAYLSPVEDHAG